MMSNFDSFLLWEAKSRDTIDFKKIYVDIAGDLVAGLLLSQIIYWYLPDTRGQSKLRVLKNDHLWIAKGREDWWDEIRITAKQFDRACKILISKGILVKDYFMFDGFRTVHIRLEHDQFMGLWNEQISEQRVRPVLPKGKDRSSPKVKTGIDERVRPITETTAETTTEINMQQSCENEFSSHFGEDNESYHDIDISCIYCGSDDHISNRCPDQDGKPQEYTEAEKTHLLAFGVLPDQDVDPAEYEMRQEIQSAGWEIYSPDVELAIVYFVLAVREHYPKFAIPRDDGTRKSWYKEVNGHLQNYRLVDLQTLYKKAMLKMQEAGLSFWRPGSLTKWTLPEVVNEPTQPKQEIDLSKGFYV